ncbi:MULTISPECIES: hypothetical protein [Phyllobacteriaceae]|jgi:hypothetical protein|nr:MULTISPECIES: hypothetical protein [Mesorhizobium]MDQ0330810.1 hypothetical protein [Mesorhizobium sp. YL-MeA3-2017]
MMACDFLRIALLRLMALLVISALVSNSASAAVDGTCTIMVTKTGTMTTNANASVLSSKTASNGYAAASITIQPGLLGVLCSLVQLLNCFALSVVPPASFSSAPSGGGTNVSFSTVFRIDGSSTDQPQNTPVKILNGPHSVQIDLIATKSSGIYAAGSYQGTVTLRCE